MIKKNLSIIGLVKFTENDAVETMDLTIQKLWV